MTNTNIQAAKFLGFKKSEEWWIVPEQYIGVITHESNNTVFLNNMKFTTSYDWAMLLVKECRRQDKMVELYSKLCDSYQENDCFGIYDLSPLQITLAALEVLEGK